MKKYFYLISAIVISSAISPLFSYSREEQFDFEDDYYEVADSSEDAFSETDMEHRQELNTDFCGRKNQAAFFASIEALLWKPEEEGLNYAILSKVPGPFSSTNDAKVQSVSPSWSWGVRTLLGYTFQPSKSDLSLSWTYFSNIDSKRSRHADDGEVLYTMVSHPKFFFDAVQNAQGKWTLYLNQIDLQFGKTFFQDDRFDLRFYLGLRGIFEEEKFRIRYEGIYFGAPAVSKDKIHLHSDFSGIGPRLGTNIGTCLGKGFLIRGDLGFSQCWGIFHSSNREKFILAQTVNIEGVDVKKTQHGTTPILDVGITIGWAHAIFEHSKITCTLGYESHYYWGINRFFNFLNNMDEGIIATGSRALSLAGWNGGVRIDF